MTESELSREVEVFKMQSAAARRYIDSINARDVNAVLELFAPDAVVMDPVGRAERIFRGHEQLRMFYEGVVTRAQLMLTGPIRGGHGDTIACEVLATIPGFEIDVITLTSFDPAGKIRKYRAFWGPANMRRVAAKPPMHPQESSSA